MIKQELTLCQENVVNVSIEPCYTHQVDMQMKIKHSYIKYLEDKN